MAESDSKLSGVNICAVKPTSKLQLDENIAAYLENRHLVRDKHIVACQNDKIERIVTNYVIAKQILSNMRWQDKLLYKHVCSTWLSAINALRKEQLCPVDFSIKQGHIKQSSTFSNEPLAVFTFMNVTEFPKTISCKNTSPCCCDPPCGKDHLVIDAIHKLSTAPKECMMGVKALYVAYMPLPNSNTKENTLTSTQCSLSSFTGGIFIPVIPNVKFNMINLKDYKQMKQQFYTAVDDIVKDNIIKGLLVFVTDKHLLNSVEDVVFFNHVKEVQPDIPYAMGGCICEDTVCDSNDINHLVSDTSGDAVSDNLISIGIFTIPKNTVNESNFDMFSLIIESSEWDKQKIHSSLTQFSKSVPRFEHSVCFKLACIGRDRKHKFEQDTFRSVFPDTPLVGCYGNGELGIDHPAKPLPEKPKRLRRSVGPHFGIIYSYSTVFVYMGWGKITLPSTLPKT
ncbi:uncharacterized protein LOC123715564 [Pieris brassicae]|uniref:uncharacterized protein LOC123715564 n=1 Tax=Pieris brassicae TaxID=7116 RepID=UPI001E65F857|nr:uncharacterized protein LOC123715564 [Pieris brassicae]